MEFLEWLPLIGFIGAEPSVSRGRLYPVVLDGKWGYMNSSGNIAIGPRFDFAFGFTAGLAAVSLGAGSPGAGSPGGRWGYIDKAGKVAVPVDFDSAGPFSEELAPVQRGGMWRFIDTTGGVSLSDMEAYIEKCREFDIFSALAGSLGEQDIEWLLRLKPDVAGFRGAVAKGDRGQPGIDPDRLTFFRNAFLQPIQAGSIL